MPEQTNVTREELRTRNAHVDMQFQSFHERLTPLENDVKRIREIVEAWDNAKGFVNVIKAFSAMLKILAVPFAILMAIWYLITTGHLPPK